MEPYPTFFNLPRKKQDLIFSVALREFGSQGYKGASINTMIKDMGIAKGSMYQYFRGKDTLFLFVLSRAMETVVDHLRFIREESKDQGLKFRLKMVLQKGIEFIENNLDVYTLYVTLLHDRTMPRRNEFLKGLRIHSAHYIQDFLDDAREKGELKPELDINRAAFLIDSVMDRFLLSRLLPHASPSAGIYEGNSETMTRWIDDLVSMMCTGVLT